jgi:isohexenylglutaconyl-CoA hydratase
MTDFDTLETLQVQLNTHTSTVHVLLNRPDTRNAMNTKMVEELYHVFTALKGNRDFRAVVLSGAGGMFCAGGDIKEMRESSVPLTNGHIDLDKMLRAVNMADQVVIAKVEGAAIGGGFGLVCVSDIAIASNTCQFSLAEVRLGVSPAYISPFVIERLGLTKARELMLTGRRFNGEVAQHIGLVHESHPTETLEQATEKVLAEIRLCAPNALASTKALIFEVKDKSLDDSVVYRANLLNTLRKGEEAQEGLAAFLQKRAPKWAVEDSTDD